MPLPQSKVSIKIQQVARYRISGRLTDRQIAELVGMTPAGLAYLMKTPEYVDLENALLEGRVSKMDEELAGDFEELRNHFRVAVPVAARTLLEVVTQRRDLRAAMAAATEILDRDPDKTFVKQKQVTSEAPGAPGSNFNPSGAGAVLATMTSDGHTVAAQISISAASPQPSMSSQTPPVTLKAEPAPSGTPASSTAPVEPPQEAGTSAPSARAPEDVIKQRIHELTNQPPPTPATSSDSLSGD